MPKNVRQIHGERPHRWEPCDAAKTGSSKKLLSSRTHVRDSETKALPDGQCAAKIVAAAMKLGNGDLDEEESKA